VPTVLFVSAGSGQLASRALDRKADFVQQPAHMTRMVGDAEFLSNQTCDHGARPYAGQKPIGHGTAIKDVSQRPLLRWGQPDFLEGKATDREGTLGPGSV